MSETILGLDLSERCAGLVILPEDWVQDGAPVWHRVVAMTLDVPDRDTERARILGCAELARQVRAIAAEHRVTAVGVEAYAFSRRSTSAHRLAELGGIVRDRLYRDYDTVRSVVASSARKTLLGRCPRTGAKVEVQRVLGQLQCPWVHAPDLCDAFAIANHLSSEVGGSFFALPVEEVA